VASVVKDLKGNVFDAGQPASRKTAQTETPKD
jgi:hypothetical protein